MRAMHTVSATALIIAAGCSSGGASGAYCTVVAETAPALVPRPWPDVAAGQAHMNETRAAMGRRQEAAPAEIRPAWDVLMGSSSDGFADAAEKVNLHMVKECGRVGDIPVPSSTSSTTPATFRGLTPTVP